MNKKNAIIAATTVTGVTALIYHILIEYLFRFGFDMQFELKGKFLGEGTQYEQGELDGVNWINDSKLEDVHIISEDGYKLVGHMLKACNPKRTLICVHGWRGKFNYDFAGIAKWLHDEGCNLVFIEQRGHQNSGGRYAGFGILERKDIPIWIEKVSELGLGDVPIYLYGVSMGCATVLMSLGENIKDKVKGVIADSGFTSPYDMIHDVGKNWFNLPEHPFLDSVKHVAKRFAKVDLKELSTLEVLYEVTTPILFFHGDEDDFVPVEMTLRNASICNSKNKVVIIEGADHIMGSLVDPDTYQMEMKAFFDENDV